MIKEAGQQEAQKHRLPIPWPEQPNKNIVTPAGGTWRLFSEPFLSTWPEVHLCDHKTGISHHMTEWRNMTDDVCISIIQWTCE